MGTKKNNFTDILFKGICCMQGKGQRLWLFLNQKDETNVSEPIFLTASFTLNF